MVVGEIRKPLQKKLKKDYIWVWSEDDTKYIRKIKNKLKDFPTLYQPQEEDLMLLETDASQEYWAGVLKAKKQDNEEKLCRYTSGTFTGAELNYHSNEKEWLAVKKAISKFRIYLLPKEFVVRTDNKQFGPFIRNNIQGDYKQGRLLRWQQWFNYYKFTIEHIKGEDNHLADTLTRELAEVQV